MKRQVFILGAYGQKNLGDDALLDVFIEQFADYQIVVNSAQPEETARQYGVRTVPTYLGWPRFARLRSLLGSELIVFGGGSLLKEIEGSHVARLLYFARIFMLLIFAKLFGRRTAMLGVGMGPLEHPLYQRLTRLAADLTGLICVRDTASRDLLLAVGVRRPVHVTADPVFTLTPGAARAARPAGSGPLAIVLPRYSLTAQERAAFAAACDHLIERHGARVSFVPFQTGYLAKFDDLAAAEAIRGLMRHGSEATVLALATAGEALDTIGRADLVLSARLHGLIFAALQGVTPIAVSYEVKVRSFMDELGVPELCLDLRDLTAERLAEVVDRAWSRRERIGASLAPRVAALREAAQRNFTLARQQEPASNKGRGFLAGSALLLASMTIVNAGNYAFNLVLGRWLGPGAFADLSLVVTLLLILSFIATALGQTTAKFAAIHAATGDAARLAGLRRWLGQRAWGIGLVTATALAIGAPLWQRFFHTQSPWPFVILGLGMPAYLAQGVDRGVLQGQTRFGLLSLSYQTEMWVRLLAAIVFVALGWSVNGAVGAVTLSLVATWAVARRVGRGQPAPAALAAEERGAVLHFAGPVLIALVGQVLINNSDVLLVKHFFDPVVAGQYAALALIGRIVFFATWSVVTAMFPIVAQRQQRGESHRQLLYASLGVVGAISIAIIGICVAVPGTIINILFGPAYLTVAPELALYALATTLYALANVVLTYRLSAGNGKGSLMVLVASLLQVCGLWLFHSSVHEVVLVQVYVMAAMFGALLLWDRWLVARSRYASAATPAPEGLVSR